MFGISSPLLFSISSPATVAYGSNITSTCNVPDAMPHLSLDGLFSPVTSPVITTRSLVNKPALPSLPSSPFQMPVSFDMVSSAASIASSYDLSDRSHSEPMRITTSLCYTQMTQVPVQVQEPSHHVHGVGLVFHAHDLYSNENATRFELNPSPSPTGRASGRGAPQSCHFCGHKKNQVMVRCNGKRKNGRLCERMWCENCIETRFSGFDFSGECCPKCTNLCNCRNCTRSSGKRNRDSCSPMSTTDSDSWAPSPTNCVRESLVENVSTIHYHTELEQDNWSSTNKRVKNVPDTIPETNAWLALLENDASINPVTDAITFGLDPYDLQLPVPMEEIHSFPWNAFQTDSTGPIWA